MSRPRRPDAQFNYGMWLENGEGVTRNLSEAARYYKMSADQEHARAQNSYGFCLYCGEGVARNLREAARYYKMSADQGDSDGQNNYGVCLEHAQGVPRNLSEAARYFKMSADQGNAFGQNNYGVSLEYGNGVRRNLSEAARYYRMSADQGDADGQNHYGKCLENGEDQGNADGQFNYGQCLANGEGVTRNVDEAVGYYDMAADQGSLDAAIASIMTFAEEAAMSMAMSENGSAKESEILETFETDGESLPDTALEAVDVSPSNVDYVKKEVKPLSEWIVDVDDLENDTSYPIQGFSENVQVFKRKSDGKVIVGEFLSLDDSGDNEIKFKREISTLFGLDHPCIVKFAGYTLPCPSTDRRFLIFTEYASGGSLSHVIEYCDRFPWFNSTARSIIIVGIVLGMRYIHSRGLFHRDLKPSNVLLDEEHHPHFCDFGSSRSFCNEVTMTGLAPVTLYYAAPELCDEEVCYNEKTDAYSFGITLYEIVTGKLALRHLNQMQVPAFIIRGRRPEIPKTVLPFTRKLIGLCWSQDPSQRPSFDDIYNFIRDRNFRLFDDADCQRVSSYGLSIYEWERTSCK